MLGALYLKRARDEKDIFPVCSNLLMLLISEISNKIKRTNFLIVSKNKMKLNTKEG